MMKGATNNNPAAAAAAAAAALEDLDLEMEALLQGLGPPPFDKPAHQLVRQGDDVLVAIASVEELNAALVAEAPPPFNFKEVLRGYVLPTASIKDCLLKAAAEAGCYSGRRFSLSDHVVVDAKISCRASVDQARAELGNAVSALSSLLTGGFARADEVDSTGGTAPYADEVESTRREVLHWRSCGAPSARDRTDARHCVGYYGRWMW